MPSSSATQTANKSTTRPKIAPLVPHIPLLREDVEQALLGSIIVKPDVLPLVANMLNDDDFYLLKHAYCWRALMRLTAADKPIDIVLLADELAAHDQLDEVGGEPFIIHSLISAATNPENAVSYAEIVKEMAQRRRLAKISDEIKALAYNEAAAYSTIVEAVGERLNAVIETQKLETTPFQTALAAHMAAVEAAIEKPHMNGIPTGFHGLDDMIGGWRRGKLYSIGARTHMGKTSFLLSVVLAAAIAGARGLFISNEETLQDLINRLLAIETGITPDAMLTGRLTPQQIGRYFEAMERMSKLPVHLTSAPHATPLHIMNMIRQHYHGDGLDIVVIDYLQNISAEGAPGKTEVERLNAVVHAIKKIPLTLNIPLLVGVQNNRESEVNGASRRPVLTDFKGTGDIEQLTDVAILLYREAYHDLTSRNTKAELIVAKNKATGKRGTVVVGFDSESTRFFDVNA